jgi:hypothetical protein
MKKNRRLVIKGETATLGVYCLKTDSWTDYLAFMADAELALATGRMRDMNRYLRAALTSLFEHVEGVVNDIYSEKALPGKRRSLCEKAQTIAAIAGKSMAVPFVNFRFEKYLRDLIAHPGITKAFSDPSKAKLELGEEEVFERLSIETLRELERRVSPWLDAVCVALKVNRLTDTKAEIQKMMPILTALGQPKIEEV